MIQSQLQELYNAYYGMFTLLPYPCSYNHSSAIDQTFSEPFSHVHVAEPDPSYYATHDFLFFRNESDLFITVKFPMLSLQVTQHNVYIKSDFPVPFPNNSDLVTLLQSEKLHTC